MNESITNILTEVPFQGSNAEGEVETLEEFLLEVNQYLRQHIHNEDCDVVSQLNFEGWTFTDIDFTTDDQVVQLWNLFNWKGAIFYGCTFPCSDAMMQQRGAIIAPAMEGIPFKVYRSFMYTQHELQQIDTQSYQFFLHDSSLNAKLAQQIHDHFLQDALFDYLEGKSVVSIMGGHQMTRNSAAYKDVALIAHRLATRGFLVASGGGPGAMEACNLGAYLYDQKEEEVLDAIQLMIEHQNPSVEFEYKDRDGPQAVIDKYGPPTYQPSLAIPTYKYGHEPTNMFGTWICKFFCNAIREDGLLDISNAGIIYTPGSAGTRQEIFQAACGNHYAEEGKEKPTIFYDTGFWNETGIPQVLRKVSEGRPFSNWIAELDEVEDIVSKIEAFRDHAGLPFVDREQLQSKFWIRPGLLQERDSLHGLTCDKKQRVARRKVRSERARRHSITVSDLMR